MLPFVGFLNIFGGILLIFSCFLIDVCGFLQTLAQPLKQQNLPPQSASFLPTAKQEVVCPAHSDTGGRFVMSGQGP